MQTASELTVILKFESSTYREKFLLYNQYHISYHDETIQACIKLCTDACNGETPEEVKIRINLVWQ